MPVNVPERDPSERYSEQVTKEIICDECGEVVMRKFMTGPRKSTEIGPPRWVTRQEQTASASPGTYETWMCTRCVNELIPQENQAYNATSEVERE